jgi:acetyl-CoA C-acetyltransferase/acetyl-CoA acyltransferase
MSAGRLVIVDGVRTPFSRMGAELSALTADDLGKTAVQALLARTALDPATVDEVIFGCVAQPVDAANISRVIALRAGLPRHVPAVTVHRNCASGCEAVTQAYEKMAVGRGEVFIVGGVESMSRIPLLFKHETAIKFGKLAKAKTWKDRLLSYLGFRISDFAPRVGLRLGLSDPVCGLNMGQTAELIGREAGITREQQDQFALESHQKAVAGRDRLAEEIAPVPLPPDFAKTMMHDNGPRPEQSMAQLGKLSPVFERNTGTVTAGNSSQITDGAVALLVMSERRAENEGLRPLGALRGYAYAACDPARMGLGPLYAMARAEQQLGLGLDQADLVEINEAFAAQVLACLARAKSTEFARAELGRDRALGEIPRDRLNVNGGSIALGHPVGASGARLVLTALKELRRRGGQKALISLCVGGGQGAALWLEKT